MDNIRANLKLIVTAMLLTAAVAGVGWYYYNLSTSESGATASTKPDVAEIQAILENLKQTAPPISSEVDLTITSNKSSLVTGENAILELQLSTGDTRIKALSAFITYDSDLLIVSEDPNFSSAEFDLEVRRDHDREAGIIEIDLGTSNSSGVSGDILIGRLNVGRLESGSTSFKVVSYQENSESDTLFTAFVDTANTTFSIPQFTLKLK